MRPTHSLSFPKRPTIFAAAVLLSALALAGCSAGSPSPTPDRGAIQIAPGPGTGVVAPEGSAASIGTKASTVDRQVIQNGFATVVVTRPLDAAAEATRITEADGGRVDGRTEHAPAKGDSGSATLTLRIPAATLTATLARLKALGTVQEVSLSATDVTMQSQDLDARIKAMSASVDRLLALLSSATNTATLITLETAISDRQGQLESMQSERRYLSDQVSMATITLNLISPTQAIPGQPDSFWSGLIAGWNAFVAFFAGLLVALGVLLPWLVFAGLVGFVVMLLVRRARRARTTGPAADPARLPATPEGP